MTVAALQAGKRAATNLHHYMGRYSQASLQVRNELIPRPFGLVHGRENWTSVLWFRRPHKTSPDLKQAGSLNTP